MTLSIERKFIGDTRKLPLALGLAKLHCVPDGDFPDNTINSIYFDTPRLLAYQHKEEGDHLKRKVRLRWYGGADTYPSEAETTVFLECKHRDGASRFKSRLSLKRPRSFLENTPLTDPAFARLLRDAEAEAGEVFHLNLHPLIHIQYQRQRFVCMRSGARVSVDWAVSVRRANRDFLPAGHFPALPHVVCEFKDNGLLEIPWAGELYHAGFRQKSFSKFGTCVSMLLNGGL